MKKLLMILGLFFMITGLPFYADAQSRKTYKPKTVKVRSYKTKSGKYVRAHYRSKPNRKKKYSYYHPIPAIRRDWAA